MSNSTFEFYKMVCDLGDREDRDYRDTFFLTMKLHFATFAGISALVSFAISGSHFYLSALVALIGTFGYYHVIAWREQDLVHAGWNAHWRGVAAAIEQTQEFRQHVGMSQISLWSDPTIHKSTDPDSKKKGTFSNVHLNFINSIKYVYLHFHQSNIMAY